MSFMGQLLSGNAPLRGRAGFELVVPALDHQLAAEFWGVDDPATALKVNAIVGGTPAYRREFARDDTPASPDLFGDYPNRVGSGTVNDAAGKTSHKVDVVAFGLDDDNRRALIAIGEVKWGETMGLGHIERLRRVRALLTAQERVGAKNAKLACFGGAGFSDDLVRAAEQDDSIALIGLDDLYRRG